MANENISSMKEAQQTIEGLKKLIMMKETEMKELQNRYPTFVDNPSNNLNKEVVLRKESVLYFPTLDKNRHFAMKFDDVNKLVDQFHIPVYFTEEESCSIFDRLFPVINDLIKFKVTFESGKFIQPSPNNEMYEVYLDSVTNSFKYDKTTNRVQPTIYFISEDVAKNCCIWLNYKYGYGEYRK